MSQANSRNQSLAKKSTKHTNRKIANINSHLDGGQSTSKPPSSAQSNDREIKEQTCDICAQLVPGPEREKIFAFGKCDHFVCYVCSTRLRVICNQNDCPICREKLDHVIFSGNRGKCFEKYSLQSLIFNQKYNIYFEGQAQVDAFDRLLRYECQKCLRKNRVPSRKKTINDKSLHEDSRASPSKEPSHPSPNTKFENKSSDDKDHKNTESTDGRNESSLTKRAEDDTQGFLKFSDFSGHVFEDVFRLKNHLNYVHKLKLCELCLTHNNLFPFEYSYYDNAELRKHMRDGEPKTSHRGHPDCVLCHHTFFNNDELIQHMSREHFHCHLCGRHDSNMRIYFQDYSSLRNHFKSHHFLCERDNCRHEQFTSAFDNRIDYQLHLVQVHGNPTSGLSRGEARHQRTITLESAPHRQRAISPTSSMRQNLPPNAAVVSTGNVATANSTRQRLPESLIAQVRQQRLPSRAEFPALGNVPLPNEPNFRAQVVQTSSINHFPSLPQTSPVLRPQTPSSRPTTSTSTTLSHRVIAGPTSSRNLSFVRTAGGGCQAPERLDEMDFPPLPEQPKAKVNKKKTKKPEKRPDPNLSTLEQLINSSLTLSSRNNVNGKKNNSKTNSPAKKVKQRPLKFQL